MAHQRLLKVIGIILALACLLVVRMSAQQEGAAGAQKMKSVNQP